MEKLSFATFPSLLGPKGWDSFQQDWRCWHFFEDARGGEGEGSWLVALQLLQPATR